MTPTFESVLSQAEKLSKGERIKLIGILSEAAAKSMRRSKTGKSISINGDKDNGVVAELKAWVDAMEKTENPKRNSSAKIAERIRKRNDRGYKL